MICVFFPHYTRQDGKGQRREAVVSGFAGELDGWFRKVRCRLRARPIPFGRWPSSDPASPAHLPPRGRLCQRSTTLQSGTTRKSLPRGGRWLRSRRMRATPRKHSVVYQRRTPPHKKETGRSLSLFLGKRSSQRSPLWLTFPARSSRGCRAGRSTARTWCRSCS